MRYITYRMADRDISAILKQTLRMFGSRQVLVYAGIIDKGIRMVAEEPLRPSSLARPDLRQGIRSFHLEIAAKRRGSASHMIYYKQIELADAEPAVAILRILHESMEPKRRLAKALFDDTAL